MSSLPCLTKKENSTALQFLVEDYDGFIYPGPALGLLLGTYKPEAAMSQHTCPFLRQTEGVTDPAQGPPCWAVLDHLAGGLYGSPSSGAPMFWSLPFPSPTSWQGCNFSDTEGPAGRFLLRSSK